MSKKKTPRKIEVKPEKIYWKNATQPISNNQIYCAVHHFFWGKKSKILEYYLPWRVPKTINTIKTKEYKTFNFENGEHNNMEDRRGGVWTGGIEPPTFWGSQSAGVFTSQLPGRELLGSSELITGEGPIIGKTRSYYHDFIFPFSP